MLILSVLLTFDRFEIFHYAYDFHKHDWVMLADILIPTVSLQAIVFVSRQLLHVPLLRSVVAYACKASLVVLLLHAFFIQVKAMIIGSFLSNEWLLALINVTECLIVYRIMTSSRYTRILIGA